MSSYRLVYLADASSVHTRRWAAYFARQGYQVHVLSFLPGDIPGVSVHLLEAGAVQPEGGNWRYLRRLPALRRELGRLDPDLVHGHYLTSYGLLAALSGYRPLALTAWGSDVLVTPRRSWLYRQLLRFTLARADLVTSDAGSMSEELLQYGLARERILTVPLGVELDLFDASGRDWPPLGAQAISTRHLLPNSNLDTVLSALARARETLPDLRLDVVGQGSEHARLQDLARQLDLGEAVAWHGLVTRQHLPALLRSADLYLAFTLSDSTSVSLLEAMACGAFPIVSDLPANREWIEPGRNGLLIPARDVQALASAIVEAARQPALRRQAAQYNQEVIRERANWDTNMGQVDGVYRRLIASPGGEPRRPE